jgi:REP element-mobilizing transposase RayT
MARKLRIQYAGAVYHVMNRGDRREEIFRDDQDRRRFLEALAEACGKTGWQVHAYCLMPNHFHLAVETPTGNLVAGMKWFLALTQRGSTGGTSSSATCSAADTRLWWWTLATPATCGRYASMCI